MKTSLLLAIVLIAGSAFSQVLPKKSTKSKIEQMVGLNEISVEYSRPNANGRVIFGDLVPYGEVWRLGANEPTKIDIKYPISINSQKLDTGSYAVFAIPKKNSWTIVFNTDTEQWGAMEYDSEKNVLEYSAAVNSCEHEETFTVAFENVEESSAVLAMRWSTVEVKVPFTTNTTEVVDQNIATAIEKGEDLAKVYYRAADFYFDRDDLDKAKENLNKSMAIERDYYNVFLEASIQHKEGDSAAKKTAEEAAKLAEKAEKQRWADYIRRDSAEW